MKRCCSLPPEITRKNLNLPKPYPELGLKAFTRSFLHKVTVLNGARMQNFGSKNMKLKICHEYANIKKYASSNMQKICKNLHIQ